MRDGRGRGASFMPCRNDYPALRDQEESCREGSHGAAGKAGY